MGSKASEKLRQATTADTTSLPVVSPSGSTDTYASQQYMLSLGITPVSTNTTTTPTTQSSSGSSWFSKMKNVAGTNAVTSKPSSSSSSTSSSSGSNRTFEQILHDRIYPDEVVDPNTGLTRKDIQDAYNNAKLDAYVRSSSSNSTGFIIGKSDKATKTANRVLNQLGSSEYNNAYQEGYDKGYGDYYNGSYKLGTETKQQISSASRDWIYSFIKFSDGVADFLQDKTFGDSGIDALDILTGRLTGETIGTSIAQQQDAATAAWAYGANMWNQVVYSMTQNIADTAATMVTMGTGGLIKGGVGAAIEGVKAATGNSLLKALTGSATNLSLSLMAIRVAGDQYQNTIINNPFASSSEALGYALKVAAIECLTEKMSGFGAIGAQGSVFNQGIIDSIWSTIGDCFGTGIMSDMVTGFLGEGFEEIVSQFAGDILNESYFRAGSEIGTDIKSTLADYVFAGLTGGISGALGAGSKYVYASSIGLGRDAFSSIRSRFDTSPNAVEAALGATESPVKAQLATAAAQQSVMQQRAAEYQEKISIAQQAFIEGARHSMQTAATLHNTGISFREVIAEIEAQYESTSVEECKNLFQKMTDAYNNSRENEIKLAKQRNENIAKMQSFMSESERNMEFITELGKKFGNKNVQDVINGNKSDVDSETALAIQYALAGKEYTPRTPQEMRRGTKEQQMVAKAARDAQDAQVEDEAKTAVNNIVTGNTSNDNTTSSAPTSVAVQYGTNEEWGKLKGADNTDITLGRSLQEQPAGALIAIASGKKGTVTVKGVKITSQVAMDELNRRVSQQNQPMSEHMQRILASGEDGTRHSAKSNAVLAEAQARENAENNKKKVNAQDRDALTGTVVEWDAALQETMGAKNFREYCVGLSNMTSEQLQKELEDVKHDKTFADVVQAYIQRRATMDAKAKDSDIKIKNSYKKSGERWCRNKINEYGQNAKAYEKELQLLKEVMEENGWPIKFAKTKSEPNPTSSLPVGNTPQVNNTTEAPATNNNPQINNITEAPATSNNPSIATTPAVQTSNSTQTVENDAKLKRSISKWGEKRCRTEYARLSQSPEANQYELSLVLERMNKLGINPAEVDVGSAIIPKEDGWINKASDAELLERFELLKNSNLEENENEAILAEELFDIIKEMGIRKLKIGDKPAAEAREITPVPPEGATPNIEESHAEQVAAIHEEAIEANNASDEVINSNLANNSVGEVTVNTNEENIEAVLTSFKEILEKANGVEDGFNEEEMEGLRDILRAVQSGELNIHREEDRKTVMWMAGNKVGDYGVNGPEVIQMCEALEATMSPFSEMETYDYDKNLREWNDYKNAQKEQGKPYTPYPEWITHKQNVSTAIKEVETNAKAGTDVHEAAVQAAKTALKNKEVSADIVKNLCNSPFTKMLVDIASKKGYTFYNCKMTDTLQAFRDSGEMNDVTWAKAQKYFDPNNKTLGLTYHNAKSITLDFVSTRVLADNGNYKIAEGWRSIFKDNSTSVSEAIENIIAHECIHTIVDVATSETKNRAVIEAVYALDSIREEAKMKWNSQFGNANNVYGFKNLREFLSEMSSPVLRSWLAHNVCGTNNAALTANVAKFLQGQNIALNQDALNNYLTQIYAYADILSSFTSRDEIKNAKGESEFFFTSSQYLGWTTDVMEEICAKKLEESAKKSTPTTKYRSKESEAEREKLQKKAAANIEGKFAAGVHSNLTSPFARESKSGKTFAMRNKEAKRSLYYATARTVKGHDTKYYIFETRIDAEGKESDVCIAVVKPGKDAYGDAIKLLKGANNFHYVANLNVDPYSIAELTPTVLETGVDFNGNPTRTLGSSNVATFAGMLQEEVQRRIDTSSSKVVDMVSVTNEAVNFLKENYPKMYDEYMRFVSAGAIDIDTLMKINPDAFTVEFSVEQDNGDVDTVNDALDSMGDKSSVRTPVIVKFTESTEITERDVFEKSVNAFVDKFMTNGLTIDGTHYSFQTATANDLKHNKLRMLNTEIIGSGPIANLRETVASLEEKVNNGTATEEESAKYKQAKIQLELNAGLNWEQINKPVSKTLTNKGVGQTGSDRYSYIKAEEERRKDKGKQIYRVFKGEGKLGEAIIVRDIFQQFSEQLMGVEGKQVGKLQTNEDGSPNISGNWKEAQDGMGLTDGSTFQMRADAMGHKGVLCRADNWQKSIQTHGKKTLETLETSTLYTDEFGRIYTDRDVEQLNAQGIKYYPMMGFNEDHSEVGLYDVWGTWQSLNINKYTGMEVHHMLTESMVKFAGSYGVKEKGISGTEDYYKWCGNKDIRIIPKENIYGSGFEDDITALKNADKEEVSNMRKLAIRQMLRGMDVTEEQLQAAMSNTEKFCKDILDDPQKQIDLVKGDNEMLDSLLEKHPEIITTAFFNKQIEKKLNRVRALASYSTIMTPSEKRQYSWILADPINIISYLSGEVTEVGFARNEESKRQQLGDITEMPANYQGTSIPTGSLLGTNRQLSEEEVAKGYDKEKIVAPQMAPGASVVTRSPMTSKHDARPVINDMDSMGSTLRQYRTNIDRDILYIQLNSSLMQRMDNDFDGDTATMMQDAALVNIIMENVKASRIAGTDNVTSFPHGKGRKTNANLEAITQGLKNCLHDAGVGKYDVFLDRIYASNYLGPKIQEEYAAMAAAGYILATDYTKTGYMPSEFLDYISDMASVLNAKVDTNTQNGKTYAKTGDGRCFEIVNGEFIPIETEVLFGTDVFNKGKYHRYDKVAPNPEYYRYGNSSKQNTWTRNHKDKKLTFEMTNPEAAPTKAPKYIPNNTNKFSNKAHDYSLALGEYDSKTGKKGNDSFARKGGNFWFSNTNRKTGTDKVVNFKTSNQDTIEVLNSMYVGGQTKTDIAKALVDLRPAYNQLELALKQFSVDSRDYSGTLKARKAFAEKYGFDVNTDGNPILQEGEKYLSIPETLKVPKRVSRMDEEFWTNYIKPSFNTFKSIVGDEATAVNCLITRMAWQDGGFESIMYSYLGDYIMKCREDGQVYDLNDFMEQMYYNSEVPEAFKNRAQAFGEFAYVETEKGEPIFSAFDLEETNDYFGHNFEYYDEDGNKVDDIETWANSVPIIPDDEVPPEYHGPQKIDYEKMAAEMGFTPVNTDDFFARAQAEADQSDEPTNPFDTVPPEAPSKPTKAPTKVEVKVENSFERTETSVAPETSGEFDEGVVTDSERASHIKTTMNNEKWSNALQNRLGNITVHSYNEGSETNNLSQEHLDGIRARLKNVLEGNSPSALDKYFNDAVRAGGDNYLNFTRGIEEHIRLLNSLYDKIDVENPDAGDVARYKYELQTTAERITAHYEQMVKSQNTVRNIQNELTKAMKNEKYRWLFGKEGKGTVGKFVSKHIVEQLSPGSLFRVLSGMNKNSEAYKFGVAMEKADILRGRMLGFYSDGLTSMLEELGGNAVKDKKAFVKQVEETRNEKTNFYGMTKGDVLNLYMAIKDDNGYFHLNNAGFESGDGTVIKCNGRNGNPTVEEVKSKVNEIVRGDEVLSSAAKMMRKVLDAYAPFVSRYRETYLGKMADETVVSNNYWIDRTGKSQNNDSVIQDDNVRMMDDFISMQSRMRDPEGCIMKIDAFESLNQYCNSMSKACSYGAIQYQVYNMSSKSYDNVEDYSLINFLDKNGFSSTVEYMQDLSNDLSGNKKNKDQFFTNVLSNFANSVLTGSVQTAVRQKASFWNAVSQIPMEYLNKYWGLTSLDSTKFTNDARIKALGQYSGVIEMRRGDVDRVTSLRENIKRNMGEEVNLNGFGQWIAEKTPEFMQGMIPGVDVQTTCRIAFACWDYVKDQNAAWRGMSTEALAKNEDFMRTYANKVEEVIPLTQPMYGMLFRSQVQRSTGIQRTMLMFRTQQGRNFNQLVEGYFNKEFNGDDTQFNMACYGLGLSAVTYSALGLLGTIIKGKADKWDEDDDGKYDLSAILKQLIKGTASAVYTTDWLGTFVGDYLAAAVSGDRYYGFEANGVAQMNDFASNSLKAISYIGNGKWDKAASATWDTILSGTQLAGIPLENAINTFLAPIRVTMTAAELFGFNNAIEQEAASRGIDYTAPTGSTVDSNDIVLSAIAEYNTKQAYEERAEALLAQYGITDKTEGYSSIKSTVITKLKEQDKVEKTTVSKTTGNSMVDTAVKEANLNTYYRENAAKILEYEGITSENTSNYSSILSNVVQQLKDMDNQKIAALPTGNSVVDSAIAASNKSNYYEAQADAILNAYGMTKDKTEGYSTIRTKVISQLKQMDDDYNGYQNGTFKNYFSSYEAYSSAVTAMDTNGNGNVTQTELRAAVKAGTVSKDVANAYWDAMVAATDWASTTKKNF